MKRFLSFQRLTLSLNDYAHREKVYPINKGTGRGGCIGYSWMLLWSLRERETERDGTNEGNDLMELKKC